MEHSLKSFVPIASNIHSQALYAAGLLFIPAIVVTKLSIVLFIRNLVPVSAHATVSLISGAGIILWGVSSEFAAAFQCRRPSSWRSGGNVCFDRVSPRCHIFETLMPDDLFAVVVILELIQYP